MQLEKKYATEGGCVLTLYEVIRLALRIFLTKGDVNGSTRATVSVLASCFPTN